MPSITKAITAQNTFTEPLSITKSIGDTFNVSIWGTFVASVVLQRSFDNGTTWLDIVSYTYPIEDIGTEPEGALYRIGVKTGAFTSGTVNVRLGV